MRPTKLTPALQRRIVALIGQGNYPEVAAQAAGIDRTTFYRWMRTGKRKSKSRPEIIYRHFYHAIKRATAKEESENISVIRRAGNKSWTARAWLLERKHPERWSRWERQELKRLSDQIKSLEKIMAGKESAK